MPFENGIPSVPTMSRVLSAVDAEMFTYAVMNWIGEICSTRNTHLAIDGKGLRAAASKVRDEHTPYILNVIDITTKLLVGQMAIPEKSNEITAIPKLIGMLDIKGSIVTIDAIGTAKGVMEAIHDGGGDFLLQVKKNNPALFNELTDFFTGMEQEKKADAEGFSKKYGNAYGECRKKEKNREHYEHRYTQAYSSPDGIKALKEERPYIESIGYSRQTRILKVEDKDGEDVPPDIEEFMKNGSSRQACPTNGDGLGSDTMMFGLIASKEMSAEEMMKYKRSHWGVETSLHYVLDETFGEDKSTIRAGKNIMSMLRKCAYNIARLLQMKDQKKMPNIPDAIDAFCDCVGVGLKFIFEPIPSLY